MVLRRTGNAIVCMHAVRAKAWSRNVAKRTVQGATFLTVSENVLIAK